MKGNQGQPYLPSRQARVDAKEQLIKDLRGVDIFAGLVDNQVRLIAEVCSQDIYENGERCAVQNETTDELRIINGGKVVVEMRIEAVPYTQTITIATLTAGNVFAYCSILQQPYIFIASGRCIGLTKIISIKASDLQRVFEGSPSIELRVMKNMAAIMCSRLRDSMTQLTRLVAEMVKQGT